MDDLMIPQNQPNVAQSIQEAETILDKPEGAPLELGSPSNPEQHLNTFHEDHPIPSNKPVNPADASDEYLKVHSGPAAATTFDYIAQNPPKRIEDRAPCNWHLEADGDRVTGTNHMSGETFEGTRVEFNRLLRGQ